MILSELRTYFESHPKASLQALKQHFHISESLLLSMLDWWIRKGRLIQCTQTPRCGTVCGRCSPQVFQIFEWVEEPTLLV